METPFSQSESPLKGKRMPFLQESITIKLLIIGVLTVALLIPAAWITHLIEERQSRANDVIKEVSKEWSAPQTLSGPILVIPYANGTTEKPELAYFLPDKLEVRGEINPEELHRGIFEAVVYNSTLAINATFKRPDFKSLNIAEENVQWQNAYMIMCITDLGGIGATPIFSVGGKEVETEPSGTVGVFVRNFQSEQYEDENKSRRRSMIPEFSENGIVARLDWTSGADFNSTTTVKLTLRGSQRLDFVPSGKTTSVSINGTWSDPSFDGKFSPATRKVEDKNFQADWNILNFNRPFARQWTGTGTQLTGSEFGVRLLVPVEQYQQSMRTAKYAHLIIILTFVSLFLVEVTRKIRIHPFQYLLIGAALVIYYTLLLSISEQLGFTIAYWIATGATVVLVSLYATSFMKNASMVILLTSLMTVFYAFLFVIILQQDLSLLIGSIGLFLTVAALMYFSRKVTWYKEYNSF